MLGIEGMGFVYPSNFWPKIISRILSTPIAKINESILTQYTILFALNIPYPIDFPLNILCLKITLTGTCKNTH